MQRFGNVSAAFGQELHGTKIHGLNNVLTLDPNVHHAFDRLKLCLEFKDFVRILLSYYVFLQVLN
jgi:hypothetical protein